MPSVKTAVSLKKQLLLEVDRIAREQKMPRSQVFVQALEAFVARYHNQALLKQLNEVYADQPEAVEQTRLKAVRTTQRRMVDGEW